jgi:RNA polymerase sigma-70 factor (ECF subfamily)
MTPQTLSLSRSRPPRIPAHRLSAPDDSRADDRRCLMALRDGHETAFIELARRHHAQMLRVARCYVGSPLAAEAVARETWGAALRALDGVDEHTSPRLWLFRILTSAAMARARSDGAPAARAGEPASGSALAAGARGRRGCRPATWGPAERRRLRALGARGGIDEVIAELPLGERLVVTLRDTCGWRPEEVAGLLAISPTTETALLRAGRRRLHAALAVRLRTAVA